MEQGCEWVKINEGRSLAILVASWYCRFEHPQPMPNAHDHRCPNSFHTNGDATEREACECKRESVCMCDRTSKKRDISKVNLFRGEKVIEYKNECLIFTKATILNINFL